MLRTSIKPTHIVWDSVKCTGCLSCMVVCSERHLGLSVPSRSRIRIAVDPLGVDVAASYCRQCRKAACAAACPQEAIQFDPVLRAWLVDDEVCSGCTACVEACPFYAIWLDPITTLAIKCDLCQGATRCAEVCPAEALRVVGREQRGAR
jgi:Fe-S-cluster-containing hydrogenase component 2